MNVNVKEGNAEIIKAQSLMEELDCKTDIGECAKEGKRMREGGKALQEAAERILVQVEADSCQGCMARLLEMRGVGYEGEGLLTEMFGKTKALAAGIAPRFIRIGKDLTKMDPTSFEEVDLAHGIKVQAMIYLGRFNYRLPKPLQDLKRSVFWLKEAIAESPRNPAQIARGEPAVHPKVPRIFLMESLLQAQALEEAREVWAEVESRRHEPLSPYEAYLKDYIDRKLNHLSSLLG